MRWRSNQVMDRDVRREQDRAEEARIDELVEKERQRAQQVGRVLAEEVPELLNRLAAEEGDEAILTLKDEVKALVIVVVALKFRHTVGLAAHCELLVHEQLRLRKLAALCRLFHRLDDHVFA